MKRTHYLWIAIAALAFSACNGVNFKKTKSGLLYKIISSNSKDSLVKNGDWLKLHYVQKVGDSVVQSSYGKMPVYQKVAESNGDYSPNEVFGLLRKGDSAVTVMLVDSIIKRGFDPASLPPYLKKGGKITISFKVNDVFHSDSAYQADYTVEMEKDMPRQQKEQAEQMAKAQKEREEAMLKEEEELEKSGEKAREINELQTYFKSHNLSPREVNPGTYVLITQAANGAAADSGKFVTVNYNGKKFATDSSFQASSFTVQLYVNPPLIAGFQDGLRGMKEGEKGTIYIAGFKGYGKNPPAGSPFKPYEALKFEVEITKVSDTAPASQQPH